MPWPLMRALPRVTTPRMLVGSTHCDSRRHWGQALQALETQLHLSLHGDAWVAHQLPHRPGGSGEEPMPENRMISAPVPGPRPPRLFCAGDPVVQARLMSTSTEPGTQKSPRIGGGGGAGGQPGARFDVPVKKKLRPLRGSPCTTLYVTRNDAVLWKRKDTDSRRCSSVSARGSVGLLEPGPCAVDRNAPFMNSTSVGCVRK